MASKASKLFQISGFAKTVLLAITMVIAGCGGGGGGGSSSVPVVPPVVGSGWVAEDSMMTGG